MEVILRHYKLIYKKEVTKMDEMNNVTMENETSMMENAPVENLVPAEAEGYTSDCGCESNANLDLGKIVKIGVGAALLIGAGVKYGMCLPWAVSRRNTTALCAVWTGNRNRALFPRWPLVTTR